MEQVAVTALKDTSRAAKLRSSDSIASKEANQVPTASAARPAEEPALRVRGDNAAANKRSAAGEARALAAAPSRLYAQTSGTTGCYERDATTSDTLVPPRFVLDTLRYALRDGSDAHVVTIPGESTTLPRGYWRIVGGAVQVVWIDNTWPPLTIAPSLAASITAIVNKSPAVSVSLRRCDGR